MSHFKFGPNNFSGDDEEEDYESEEDEDGESGEDEDNDAELASLVPQAYQTTKGNHAEQKEAVVDEDYDYDSEEDEDDALEREVSWRFWESLMKQSASSPKVVGNERRTLDTTNISPRKPAMSTGAVESTSDGSLTDSNREPDAQSIRMREKVLHQLQFLKFTGDRDTKPSTVDWFLQLVAEYVGLGGGVGVSQDNRLINTVLENLSREPWGGKDRAYRWAISWIGSQSGQSIYTAGSYNGVINFGTGKNMYKPPSTVPVHQHYPFSWIEFVDAFMDEFNPERREASRFRKNAFDRGRQESSIFRGEESHRRSKDTMRESSKDNNILQIASAFRYRSQDFGQFEKDSEKGLALEKRVALLEKHIHFFLPPSPAFRLEDVGTSSDSVPTSVLVATLEVSDAAARGDFIPTGPFSFSVLTASTPSSDALQDTSNHTASESDWQASLKRSRDKPVNELALKTPDFKATEVASPQKISLQTQACRLLNDCSTEPEPTIVTAGTPLHAESVALKKSDETAKWQKEAQNQQALATKWQLACKIPDCNLPNLATLDVDLEDIRPLSVNAGATDWQQNAKDWTSLVTKWRNRYNTIQKLVRKIPTYKPTKICPAGPTPSSLLARTNSDNTPIILTVDTPQDSTRAPQRDPTSTQLLADEDCVSTSRSCPGSAASEDPIPAGPFSSAVLTAPLRNALQAKIPNLAGLNGEVQLKADTSNHTAPESDREASLKPTTRSLTSWPRRLLAARRSKFLRRRRSACRCKLVCGMIAASSRNQPLHFTRKTMVRSLLTSAPQNFAVLLARTQPTAAVERASFSLKNYLPLPKMLLGY
ncbi:hypothetical protein FN846DRAFT_895567 [Sphaerosporella brunnea]|uniref:Uncharacterized protein n=1 Tax=Sphaerosporella brunnea TaxID=1250544 RepID=A0A5J5EF98_9PEZI|nr:hypothetical protein FN846DRAFT_895567 [Sphaerosporella brunnea]